MSVFSFLKGNIPRLTVAGPSKNETVRILGKYRQVPDKPSSQSDSTFKGELDWSVPVSAR